LGASGKDRKNAGNGDVWRVIRKSSQVLAVEKTEGPESWKLDAGKTRKEAVTGKRDDEAALSFFLAC